MSEVSTQNGRREVTAVANQVTQPATRAREDGNVLPPNARDAAPSRTVETPPSAAQAQETVSRAVANLNDYVQSFQRDLKFSVDQDLGRAVVWVVDRNTDKVIRQIPNDVALQLARNLQANAEQREVDALQRQQPAAVDGEAVRLGLVNLSV